MSDNKEFCFNIGSLKIPYSLSASTRCKNIRLVIDINGLKVVTPLKTKPEEVDKLLKAKSNWIYKHYMNFQSFKVAENNREWQSGESILYKGDKYFININTYKHSRTLINFNGNSFEVYVNERLDESERKDKIKAVFRKWYMQSANEHIRDKLDYYCRIMGLSYNSMRIKEQKTRWGSCSRKGNLNFNWKLIMSPQWVIDYVIIHELCHLKHLNHSKKYWNLVALYMPEYNEAREWLKKNGPGLVL